MLKRHTISFKNAFAGLIWSLKTQPNYRIHLFLTSFALLGGWYLQISYVEFLIVLTLIFVGLAIETVNTAIEATTDAVSKEWRQDIKIAKDAAAGSMLIFSIGAFIVACIIFIPKLLALNQ